MTETALVPRNTAALAEQVAIKGDLSKLTEDQRMAYYSATCESLGLNPLTRPFDYITLNGKMVLYANRTCADQLRANRGITITSLDPRQVGDLFVVVATGRDRDGREDSSTGAVNVKGLYGEQLANAMMKCETKAKRRLTLSLAGLGWSDETEIETIPGAQRTDVDADGVIKTPTLAERAAVKAAEVKPIDVHVVTNDDLMAEADLGSADEAKPLSWSAVQTAAVERGMSSVQWSAVLAQVWRTHSFPIRKAGAPVTDPVQLQAIVDAIDAWLP